MQRDHDTRQTVTGGTKSVLLCRAPHPRGLRGDSRFEGRLCGKRLQVVPFLVRPTYRTIRDWSDVHTGCIAVRCLARDCRAFTEYEIVNAGAQGRATHVDSTSDSPLLHQPNDPRKKRVRR
jgi:hypothetical protein